MTVKQQLMKEIEDLPLDAQEKVLKLVHFVKEEIFVLREKISIEKKRNALADVQDSDRNRDSRFGRAS